VLEGEVDPALHRADPEAEVRQKARLEGTRAARDGGGAEAALAALVQAAKGDQNLMPLIIDCARARVSEGEMVEALQGVFGTYTEHPQF
jgi:methylmalonyl-CoA mutase N-terminal domain/subunit